MDERYSLALTDKITYFRTPSDIAEQKIKQGQRFRLGGLVEQGSVKRGASASVEFSVTDTLKTQAVSYSGILPDLFREGRRWEVALGHRGIARRAGQRGQADPIL